MDENQYHENPTEGAPQDSQMNQGSEQQGEAPMPEPKPAGESKSYGAIVGIVIIVILLILAGFYFWGGALQDKDDAREDDATEEVMEETEEVVEDTTATVPAGSEGAGTNDDTAGAEEVPLSESDEIEDLEAELDSTIIDELDAELSDIDEELNF